MFDLYVWASPRDLDADRAEALIEGWEDTGGNPSQSPFEPSTDVGWFHRELMKGAPGLDVSSDAVPNPSKAPIWLSTDSEPPARIVAMRLSPDTSRDVLDSIFGLAMKYDLVLFDARSRRVHLPLEEMTAYADATFWPSGAIQAAVAGGLGGLVAVVAWIVAIPVLSWILAIGGGFMFVMAVYSFLHEGRKAIKRRRTGGESPPRG
jgi:hypothetical protein